MSDSEGAALLLTAKFACRFTPEVTDMLAELTPYLVTPIATDRPVLEVSVRR
jgi:hypothetical protein